MPPRRPPGDEPRLTLQGGHWRLSAGSVATRLPDMKGLHYLAELLAHPGREHHVLDLVTVTEGTPTEPGGGRRRLGDAGPLLDAAAKAAYKRRLAELHDDLDEALAWNDGERAERAEAEIDAVVRELSRAVGLGGRDRKAASAAERARLNVTRAVRSAIRRIGWEFPALGAHLDRCVRTGLYCSYQPDGSMRVRIG